MTDRDDEIELELSLRKLGLRGRLFAGTRLKTDDEMRVEIKAEMDERLRQAARRRVRAEAIPRPRQAGPVLLPVPRKTAHAAAILDSLRRLGFDPLRLPATPKGRPSAAKAAARKALQPMTPAVFDKAWQALRADGGIVEAEPSDKLAEGRGLRVRR